MDVFAQAERMMDMDERTWLRHANPWSVWSRFLTCVPLISLAVWSRVWLGWYALVPVALSLAWTWWNPRAFQSTDSTDNWMSKGVFGEQIWIAKRAERHSSDSKLNLPNLLVFFCALGLVPFAWGLFSYDIWATVTGLTLIVGGKLWFLDRMVRLYEQSEQFGTEYSKGVGQ